jgi:hypothetical protein
MRMLSGICFNLAMVNALASFHRGQSVGSCSPYFPLHNQQVSISSTYIPLRSRLVENRPVDCAFETAVETFFCIMHVRLARALAVINLFERSPTASAFGADRIGACYFHRIIFVFSSSSPASRASSGSDCSQDILLSLRRSQ